MTIDDLERLAREAKEDTDAARMSDAQLGRMYVISLAAAVLRLVAVAKAAQQLDRCLAPIEVRCIGEVTDGNLQALRAALAKSEGDSVS